MLAEQAMIRLKRGDQLAAVREALASVEMDRDCLAGYAVLARIALLGINYQDLLARVHRHVRPRTYLEIGVERGVTLRLAGEMTQAIGIDPEPRIEKPLPSHMRVIQATSDDFFARHDVRQEFGGLAIELAFIDGMHLFEFALRDFINIERHAAQGATVLVHDCYPLDEITSARQRMTTFWTGDVWKLIACLRKHRPDLRIHTLACPPTGIAVIRGLDPASGLLPSQMEALCSEFIGMPYAAIEEAKQEVLGLVPGDWERMEALLN